MNADELEAALGDADGDGPFGSASVLAHDERERLSSEACAALHACGYVDHLVPVRDGGRLVDLHQLVRLGRVVARRDLTVAVATGQTFLGALPVWLDGDEAQRAHVAALVRAGRAGCLALTEEAHGSDLAANEVRLEGAALFGTKWCINNATRSRFLSVLARAGASGAQSLVLVDKERTPAGWTCLPRLRTHGIRGADISAIRFDGVEVASVVGRGGGGLDLVLRTLQLSRTVCAAFSLGAADTALGLARRFASDRVLYGAPAIAIPVVRAALESAGADLAALDALTAVACSAASVAPETMSVVSATVKALVPNVVDEILREAGIILGARAYLREGSVGHFQKLVRDHAVVALFDGSTAVNLAAIASQLPRIVEARAAPDEAFVDRLFAAEAPPLSWRGFRASARGADPIVSAIPVLARRGAGDPELAPLATELVALLAAFDHAVLAHAASDPPPNDATAFALARRFCLLAAGAACLGRRVPAPVLRRVLERLRPS